MRPTHAARRSSYMPAAAARAPRLQRRATSEHIPPLASLAAILVRPGVQRKCGECPVEDTEEMLAQPRLEVGPVSDRYESEADAIAARVMAMGEADVSSAAPSVQRACSGCASSDEEPKARRTAPAETETDEDEPIRARHASAEGGPETIRASHAELTCGGSALPPSTRGFFEARMGRDLSDVRVHKGGGANDLNRSIAARAFTYRNHVWLGGGESASPSFTMAHELAHVMQQTAPGPVEPMAETRMPADPDAGMAK